jgi:hypothetical protein
MEDIGRIIPMMEAQTMLGGMDWDERIDARSAFKFRHASVFMEDCVLKLISYVKDLKNCNLPAMGGRLRELIEADKGAVLSAYDMEAAFKDGIERHKVVAEDLDICLRHFGDAYHKVMDCAPDVLRASEDARKFIAEARAKGGHSRLDGIRLGDAAYSIFASESENEKMQITYHTDKNDGTTRESGKAKFLADLDAAAKREGEDIAWKYLSRSAPYVRARMKKSR